MAGDQGRNSWFIGKAYPPDLVSYTFKSHASFLNLIISEALHEPYVLAFEPSFVEIRHIETGLMAQVIQGRELRLLFADTPPSVTNNAAMHQSPYSPYDQNPYGNSPNSASPGGRGNGYGLSPQNAYPAAPYPRHPQGIGREEILMVSEDRVVSLRIAGG